MTGQGDDTKRPASRQDQRTARLEAALRANLKKRKDQGRSRSVPPSPDGGQPSSALEDEPQTGGGGGAPA